MENLFTLDCFRWFKLHFSRLILHVKEYGKAAKNFKQETEEENRMQKWKKKEENEEWQRERGLKKKVREGDRN